MKIALLGYGRMGKTIEGIALEEDHEVVLRITSDNQQELTPERLRQAEVAIDFSIPSTAFDNIKMCLENGVPVVSGTTAWLDKMPEAKALVDRHKGAFFYASNYSVGVNLFFAINRYLANLMATQEQYEVKMTEVHHTQKLDAPSGTAISLAEDILRKLNRKQSWVNDNSNNPSDLEIISKREEGVPGTHLVQYISAVDQIEIQHTAHSREGFAKGALLAAKWLIGRQGYFEMKDMLGF